MAPDSTSGRTGGADHAARLAAVAATSTRVAATRSRNAKVAVIAELLAGVPEPDAVLAADYLSGIVPQGRLGIGWRTLAELPDPAAAGELTLQAVDEIFTELSRTAGPGSVQRRRELLNGLMSAATAAEQRFLTGLIRGELRQGALDAIVIQAVAEAAGVADEVARRAAMLTGSVSAIVAPALGGGEAALGLIGLQVGTPVLPMLAASAPRRGQCDGCGWRTPGRAETGRDPDPGPSPRR